MGQLKVLEEYAQRFWNIQGIGDYQDKEKRAVMNIKYTKEIVEACRKLEYTVSGFDRSEEPKKEKTMTWGTREAIKKTDTFPDVIYDTGAKGKEAMIRVIGTDAIDAVNKVVRIAKLIR